MATRFRFSRLTATLLVVAAASAIVGPPTPQPSTATVPSAAPPLWLAQDGPSFSGDFDPLSGTSASALLSFSGPSAPAFGALVYEDFKAVERTAREHLHRGLRVRQALSPYQDVSDFDTIVRQFDVRAGWSQEYPTGGAAAGVYPGTLTVLQLVEKAEEDLLAARDLYGYLAVFGPEDRFHLGSYYVGDPPPGFDKPLCAEAEDPNPPDPSHSGQVRDPIVDWCDFKARLRQSVREAANLRLIFGQEFMVQAFGLHFSGTDLVGGEQAVAKEVAQLQAAVHQYDLAEQHLTEALDRMLGDGCRVSDFYGQSEWALLSRAAESRQTARHHIAVRESYAVVGAKEKRLDQRVNARETLREAATEGHLEMIRLAAQAAGRASAASCVARGTRPDGQLVADLARNVLETQRRAREMADGRNIFGFDVTFTPDQVYKESKQPICTGPRPEGAGLWELACGEAVKALDTQDREVAATRAFEDSQEALLHEIENILSVADGAVSTISGCKYGDIKDSKVYAACAADQAAYLRSCLSLVATDISDPRFEACLAGQGAYQGQKILGGSAEQALRDLRSIYADYVGIRARAENITLRVLASDQANATVTSWLDKKGTAETAARVTKEILQAVQCFDFSDLASGTAQSAAACAVPIALNTVAAGVAGAMSMEADIGIADAEHNKEVRNLLLDQMELAIDAYAKQQQFLSRKSQLATLLTDLDGDVQEANRQRTYLAASPANDPSYRMVRDSQRLQLAKQLEQAAIYTYLAARRAEYEFAARLSLNGIRISDVYRARTAEDIMDFLSRLGTVTGSLPGSADYQISDQAMKISVARDVLLLTDPSLAQEGFTSTAAAQAERTRRFRAWVAEHTGTDKNVKEELRFGFSTSLIDGGLYQRAIGLDHRYWLLKLTGLGEPKPTSNGVRMNLVSAQTGLDRRGVRLTHGGLVHLRNFDGCVWDFRLVATPAMLGLHWPIGQPVDEVYADFHANVNGVHGDHEVGFASPSFSGRSVSSTNWIAQIATDPPTAGLPKMDLQKLTDVEILLSYTRASRAETPPELEACTRIDW